MMALKDDLIAAKGLIDTPEKMGPHRGVVYAMLNAREDVSIADFNAMRGALIDCMSDARIPVTDWAASHSHPDIMALFDRAIAKAEGK